MQAKMPRLVQPRGIALRASLLAFGLSLLLWTPQPYVSALASQDGSPGFAQEAAAAVERLNNPDPEVRDEARRSILRARIDTLPSLLEAVRKARDAGKLPPQARGVLGEAVLHAHLVAAKERYFREVGTQEVLPFLGIRTARAMELSGAQEGPGLVIADPIPGFNAYEHFREGDLLFAMRDDRGLIALASLNHLQDVLRRRSPGDIVEFRVVRGGQVISFPFQLDRQLSDGSRVWREMEADAKAAAERFIAEHIAPLFPGDRTDTL